MTATFFVLGYVADRAPDLIREVEARGHEIATHGYNHEEVTNLTRAEFRSDVERSIESIEAAIDGDVHGYRASSFSITGWALDVLRELGLTYDSSSSPVRWSSAVREHRPTVGTYLRQAGQQSGRGSAAASLDRSKTDPVGWRWILRVQAVHDLPARDTAHSETAGCYLLRASLGTRSRPALTAGALAALKGATLPEPRCVSPSARSAVGCIRVGTDRGKGEQTVNPLHLTIRR